MILDRKEDNAGVLALEAWVNADEFYRVAARYDAPLRDFLIEAQEDLAPV